MTDKRHKAILPETVIKDVHRMGIERNLFGNEAIPLLRLLLPPATPFGVRVGCEMFIEHCTVGYGQFLPLAESLQRACSDVDKHVTNFQKSDWIAVQYPVFTGWREIVQATREMPLVQTGVVVAVYLELCRSAFYAEQLTPDVYYQDARYLRDTILLGLRSLGLGWRDCADPESLRTALSGMTAKLMEEGDLASLHEELRQEPLNTIDKITRVNDLLSGVRHFGSPVYVRGSTGPRGPRNPIDAIRVDPILIEPPGIIDVVGESEDGVGLPNGAPVEFRSVAEIGDKGAGELSVRRSMVMERKAGKSGSCLSPTDDRRSLHEYYDSYQRQGVITVADPRCVPLISIARYMSYVLTKDRLAWVFIMLLLITGLPPDRLEKLLWRRKRFQGVVHDPVLERRSSIMSYRLVNGPVDFLAKARKRRLPSGSLVMRVAIPKQLLGFEGIPDDRQPFTGMAKKLRTYEAHFNDFEPGPTPTAERLCRSFWVQIASHGLTDMEAGFINGTVPTRIASHSNYYCFNRATLQQRFAAAVRWFLDDLSAHPAASQQLVREVQFMTFPPACPEGKVGSQIAAALGPLSEFFETCRKRFVAVKKEWKRAMTTDQLPLMTEALNIQSVQYYALIQMLGLRPVGEIAVVSFSSSSYGAWIKDKGGASFWERSLSPLPTAIRDQDRDLQRSITRIREACRSMKHKVEDMRRPQRVQLPAVFELNPKKRLLQITTMSGARYRTTLAILGLTRFLPPRNNFVRHSIASHFHGLIPGPVLDQILGHHRQGLDVCSPWSSAKASGFHRRSQDLVKTILAMGSTRLQLLEK
jgi:hypothetical protein